MDTQGIHIGFVIVDGHCIGSRRPQVSSAPISPSDAQQRAERGRRPDLLLRPAVEAMPALRFVQEVFAEDRAQLAHAVGMILVVITSRLRASEGRERLVAPNGAAPPQ